MKVLLLLATLVAIEAKSTNQGTCKVSEWGEWSKWSKAYHDNTVKSWPAGEKTGKGRAMMTKIRQMMEDANDERTKCRADGSCPELALKADEGYSECTNGQAGGRDYLCSNVDQMSLTEFPTLSIGQEPNSGGNDCWGWTDPLNGMEVAIMGCTTGSSFVDITNPSSPQVLAWMDTQTSSSSWRDMKVVNDHAFIVSEASGHGIQVFDLTRLRSIDPSNPQTVTPDFHYDGLRNCHNIISDPPNNRIYSVGCTGGPNDCGSSAGGLHILDVSNPTNPQFLGCFNDDGYVHDAQCQTYNGPDTEHQGKQVCYCYNEDTFTIADVTDTNNMAILSRTDYQGAAYTHQGWVTEDESVILLDDEADENGFGDDGHTITYIWDISDLDAPTLENTYVAAHESIDHNQYILGDLTYQSNYESGLRILRIDQASYSLTEVGYFDVLPTRNTANFNGAWSVYPYFNSGNVIISSIDYGLFVVRPNIAAMQAVESPPLNERARYRSILEAGSGCPPLAEVEHY